LRRAASFYRVLEKFAPRTPMPTAPKSPGQLERVLRAGHFAVTAETSPTATTDAGALVERCRPLKGVADAVNVTDGATAKAHLSSLVVAGAMAKAGIEPVLQFTVRDRNRIALQGDLLGAAALGVPNILSLTGDDPKRGEEPEAKPVNDLSSTGLIALAKKLRDEGQLSSGREIAGPPRLFLGAADAPMDPKPEWKPDSLAGKIVAGADFVQTQYCFDLAMLRRYMARLADHGIPEKIFIIVGIGPLASAKQARWMHENLWGVSIPEPIVKRLDGAADQKAEGRKICAELIQELATVPGVAGAHLMAPRQEAEMAAAIALSGVLKRRGTRAASGVA
jgi:methylenetetrahydrofolate reductase (NADPH)